MLTLIADTRERDVITMLKSFPQSFIEPTITTINIGDYALYDGKRLVAIFERKTWKDFAASMVDGRSRNNVDLLDIRRRTGCRVYYIVEGPAFPHLSKKLKSNVEYGDIRSKMNRLTIRYNFMVERTKNIEDTAKFFIEYAKGYQKLIDQGERIDFGIFNIEEYLEIDKLPRDRKEVLYKQHEQKHLMHIYRHEYNQTCVDGGSGLILITNNDVDGANKANVANVELNRQEELKTIDVSSKEEDVAKELKVKKKTNADYAYELMTSIPGIGDVLANTLRKQCSVKDILICSNIRAYLEGITMINGKRVMKNNIDKIEKFVKSIQDYQDKDLFNQRVKNEMIILSNINGISQDSAAKILSKYKLLQLLFLTADQIAVLEYEAKDRKVKKVGVALAKKIVDIITYIDK
jgi:ERCC4-type nuclease